MVPVMEVAHGNQLGNAAAVAKAVQLREACYLCVWAMACLIFNVTVTPNLQHYYKYKNNLAAIFKLQVAVMSEQPVNIVCYFSQLAIKMVASMIIC